MQYKSLNSFIGGVYERRNTESRIPDQFLIKQVNIDSDRTGRLERRPGYDYWNDLKDNNSTTSQLSIPDISTFTGFTARVQNISEYADVAGIRYLVIVSDGKAYIEERASDTSKIWTCLNPTGNIDFTERNKHIDVVSYLNIIFFNDYRNNVYMYDTYAYSRAGWTVAGSRYIYFAGQRIMFRNFSTYDAEWHIHNITALIRPGAPNDEFTIDGNYVHHFSVGDIVTVEGSTGNDGDYTVTALNYDSVNDETDIKVSTAISDATADGTIKSVYRILIEDNSVNFAGKQIFDSLSDINYIGGGNPAPTAGDLYFSFCYRTGNSTTGYYYYVLDNAKNQRANDKCYIVKFDDRFIAQDYVELDMDTNGEILNFGFYNGNLYVFAEDGKIHVLDEDLTDSPLGAGTDVADLTGISITGGNKQYSIDVNDNGEIYVATMGIPAGAWDYNFSYQDIYTDIYKGYSQKWVQGIEYGGIGIALDGSDKVYITASTGIVKRIDATADMALEQTATVDSGKTLRCMHYAFSKLWVGGSNNSGILRIVPATLAVDGTIAADPYCLDIIDDGTYIWALTGSSSNKIKRYNPTTLSQVGSTVTLPETSRNLTWDGTYIWAGGLNCVYKINPSTYTYTKISFGTGTFEATVVHYAGSKVWGGNNVYLYEINPTTNAFSYDTHAGIDIQRFHDDGTYLFARSGNSGSDEAFTKIRMSDRNISGRFYWCTPTFGSNKHGSIYNSNNNRFYLMTVRGLLFIEPDGSNYQNIVRLTTAGAIYYNASTWNTIYHAGSSDVEITDIKPINATIDDLYFGSKKYTTWDEGWYVKLNFTSKTFLLERTYKSSYKYRILGTEDKWFMRAGDATGSGNHRAGRSWEWDIGYTVYDNLEDYSTTYHNNVVFHIYKSVSTFDSNIDRIKYLGTPKPPFVTFENGTSDFIAGTRYRYYLVFRMYSLKTTALSPHSEEIEIPQMNTSANVTFTNATDKVNYNSHPYSDGDIVRFSNTGGALPAEISADTNYYVVNAGANDFEIEESVGGGTLDFTDDGTGTSSVVKCSDEPIKIILTGLNIENDYGFDIYAMDDVEEIHVYRSELEYGGTVWSDPTYIQTLEKYDDGSGSGDQWWVLSAGTPVYSDPEYSEDNTASYTYNPFTFANVFDYPVNHICVHKNRLILINRIDYTNVSIIEYSDVDSADAIPPDNKRGIQSGDGDYMVAGVSMGDILYLFKTEHIYGILGDAFTGEIIDIDRNIGTEYKNLIIKFEGIIYFLNNKSIYAVSGTNPAVNIGKERLHNYFDVHMSNCIDFENIGKVGYGVSDEKNRYIKFYVPQKVNGLPQTENNLCIIYDIENKSFKHYQYAHNIFLEKTITDILTEDAYQLLADHAGNVYEMNDNKNDFGKPISWLIRTKAFNIGTSIVRKHFKLIKIVGRFFSSLRVAYWIDGKKQSGSIVNRQTENNLDDVTIDVLNGRRANTLMVELNGKDVNEAPMSVEEILIGYNRKKSIR